MAQDPAFLFYSADFLVGTSLMTDDQKGKYITLMCLQHQSGHLSEEDMLKICGSYDKDIFRKFSKDDDGLYYNERLKKEINKRGNFINSRRTNRLGKKVLDTSASHEQDMLNTSASHVNGSKSHLELVENDNTNSILLDSKEDKNKEYYMHMTNTCASCDKDMIMDELKFYGENWHLQATTATCLCLFMAHKDFKNDRDKVFEKIKYQLIGLPDDELWERIEKWAKLFNDRNDGQYPKRTMRGKDSWPQHFYNWFVKQDLKTMPNLGGLPKSQKTAVKSAKDVLKERGLRV